MLKAKLLLKLKRRSYLTEFTGLYFDKHGFFRKFFLRIFEKFEKKKILAINSANTLYKIHRIIVNKNYL